MTSIENIINSKNTDNLSLDEILNTGKSDEVVMDSNKETIMVVDDDQHQLSSIKKLLNKRFNIISCSNGNQAIRQYKEHESEIMTILLDIRLPDMDGFEVFNHIKEINVNIPIIFITGYQSTYGDGFDIYKKYRPHGYIVKNHANEVEMIMDSLLNAIQSYKHVIELERSKIFHEKNRMLAGLLHDLKNMFAPILMMPDLIKRFIKADDMDRTFEMLERLKKMTQFFNANQLVLFQYSKEKNITVQLQSMNIKHSLDEFLEMLEMQYSKRFPINVEYLYDGDIVADKNTLFTQVVLNIIKNSSDAFHVNQIKDPKIDITVMTFEDYADSHKEKLSLVTKENIQLVIIVGDNAGGLPSGIESTFFDPYVSKGKKDGTGLGSWMIKNGVEDILNGQLLLDNLPGKGLHYHIFI